jgi:adenylate cyclase
MKKTNSSVKLPAHDAQPFGEAACVGGQRIERRLAAALALDIVNYSLMIGHDDEGTHHRVGKALARVNRQVCHFKGNVVSFAGDGLMAVFPSSRAALRCGVAIQKELRCRSVRVEPRQRIVFRVGIHVGELVFQGWRTSGDALNIAARLERICRPGEICISATLLDQAERTRGIALEGVGTRKLKNIRQPIEVYRVALVHSVEAGVLDGSIPAQSVINEFEGRQPLIAVLPLGYVGGGAGDAYFVEDILERIIASLNDLKEHVVVVRPLKAHHVGRHFDVRDVCQSLGVRYILGGNVRRSTTTARVTTELCDAENGILMWADTTEVLLGERFDWQDRIARRIIAGITTHIREEELRRTLRGHPAYLAARDPSPEAVRRMEQLEAN